MHVTAKDARRPLACFFSQHQHFTVVFTAACTRGGAVSVNLFTMSVDDSCETCAVYRFIETYIEQKKRRAPNQFGCARYKAAREADQKKVDRLGVA